MFLWRLCGALFLLFWSGPLKAGVLVGLDLLFKEPYREELRNKRVGLITNSSALNKEGETAFEVLKKNQKAFDYKLIAAFAPEHGFEAKQAAFETVQERLLGKIPIYSLHGSTKRPTDKMLEGLDLLIYDIQTVGVRCYTYETTLLYALEEAAQKKLPVLVLDRPDPRGGCVVEGKGVEENFKCFFSYHDVPFCHGMTIGELALYFNAENELGCSLKVIPMKGWKHGMTFEETGLFWKAPSPNMPDAETTLVYPATIVLGETLEMVSVDLRGEKPFKRLGAPWISKNELSLELNQMDLPGVLFSPDTFVPSWGKYEGQLCEGVFLKVTNHTLFQPLLTQYILFEKLLELYPQEFDQELEKAFLKGRKKVCHYLTGSRDLMTAIENHDSISQTMKVLEKSSREKFLEKRAKFLLYSSI